MRIIYGIKLREGSKEERLPGFLEDLDGRKS